MASLRGSRVLVVGASKGLGRAIARRLHDDGAELAVAGRTTDLLDDLAGECDGRPLVVRCDVGDAAGCARAVQAAAEHLGGLDALVYTPGTTVVSELAALEPGDWSDVFTTNVFGAAAVTSAAVPYLEATNGVAVYFSSVSAHVTPPWRGMGLYATSKVALEKSLEVWKLEHPGVRFTTVVVGSTSGGHFFRDATVRDEAALDRFRREWSARGYLAAEPLRPEDQADTVAHVLASDAQMDVVWVRPRGLFQLPDGGSTG